MSELRIWAYQVDGERKGYVLNCFRVCRTYQDRPTVAGMVLMEPLIPDTTDLGSALRALILEARKTGEVIAECDMDALVKHVTGWQKAPPSGPPALRVVRCETSSETPALAPAKGE